MTNRTKIVCTIGPAVESPEQIEALIDAGMNVARLNFSHNTHEEHGKVIARLKAARKKKGVPLAIMLDTKGPEIRLGMVKDDQFTVEEGSHLWLLKEEVLGDAEGVSMTPTSVFSSLKEGTVVLLDNGYIITRVVEVSPKGAKVLLENGGEIRSKKGVNIPGAHLDLPPMTEKDMADLRFGCEQDIDLVAASFTRSGEHLLSIKKLLADAGKPDIAVIAKIENYQGVQNFDDIVHVANGIMVARGDLGVEMSLTQVPRLQKMMIRKSYLVGKMSVTATQMLESMITNPRPTRAEASDVANAIYDSTSAVMLSGETAVGHYPIEVVKMMKAIIVETEGDFGYYEFFKQVTQRLFYDVPSSVAQATINTAYSTHAKAIFALTTKGSTARLLSCLRPEMPIFALTPNEKVFHQLSICWGVTPVLGSGVRTIEEAKRELSSVLIRRGLIQPGDLVVTTAGTPFGEVGSTNMMIVDTV